ncbi:CRISPR-associated protein Cas4 [Amycolatopsis anabasis]|uniref:CRISPR-associated protein Cas4 n=1 Tax=Amycolatopsis anabasis TaxID=1840409 RepID=UPI001C551D64|nr:CRISPR-associated protein Cas4 [Amycolatopsis anabasis]
MIGPEDIGGVHIKYLHHCRRQLWLYSRGFRPEHLSELVQYGQAVHDTSYTRMSPIDLGGARLDHIDGDLWVHEVKSSGKPTAADRAQAIHYCHRLRALGIPARGAILHYHKTRRTHRIPYDPSAHDHQARTDITTALDTITQPSPAPRLARHRCHGCSYLDYCWNP